jgi:hypothetical protein
LGALYRFEGNYLDRWNLSELREHAGKFFLGKIFSEIFDENVGETLGFLSKFLLTLFAGNKLSDVDLISSIKMKTFINNSGIKFFETDKTAQGSPYM